VLYLFDVYALVVGTVAVVTLAVWLTSYAFLLGGIAIARRLRVAAEGRRRPVHESPGQVREYPSSVVVRIFQGYGSKTASFMIRRALRSNTFRPVRRRCTR
jgi:hypothetical protein